MSALYTYNFIIGILSLLPSRPILGIAGIIWSFEVYYVVFLFK
jgi:hypothetical protein